MSGVMNERWTDFEKLAIRKLFAIEKRLSRLEGRAMVWGASAGLIGSVIASVVAKMFGAP